MRSPLALVLALAALLAGPARAETPAQRGAYLVAIMGCGDCHTPGQFTGASDPARRLGGGDFAFLVADLGYFWAPNLTPDRETGLGAWTNAQIVAAITKGERPDGRILVPSMPWQGFARLTAADANAIVAYLRSLPAVRNQVHAPQGLGETPAGAYLKLVPAGQ